MRKVQTVSNLWFGTAGVLPAERSYISLRGNHFMWRTGAEQNHPLTFSLMALLTFACGLDLLMQKCTWFKCERGTHWIHKRLSTRFKVIFWGNYFPFFKQTLMLALCRACLTHLFLALCIGPNSFWWNSVSRVGSKK